MDFNYRRSKWFLNGDPYTNRGYYPVDIIQWTTIKILIILIFMIIHKPSRLPHLVRVRKVRKV